MAENSHPMDLEAIHDKIEAIDVPGKQKKALLSLMNLKIDTEMDKSITRFEAAINGLKTAMDSKFAAIDDKFSAIDSKFDALDAKFTNQFNLLDAKFTSQFNFLKWIIGGLIVVLSALITILKYVG